MKIKNQTAMAIGACAAMGIGVLLITFSMAPTASEFWSLLLERGGNNNFAKIVFTSAISVVALALTVISRSTYLSNVILLLTIIMAVISFGLITLPFAIWAVGASAYWAYRKNTQQ